MACWGLNLSWLCVRPSLLYHLSCTSDTGLNFDKSCSLPFYFWEVETRVRHLEINVVGNLQAFCFTKKRNLWEINDESDEKTERWVGLTNTVHYEGYKFFFQKDALEFKYISNGNVQKNMIINDISSPAKKCLTERDLFKMWYSQGIVLWYF